MMQKSEDFSSRELQQAMRMANSDTARQLYALLQSTNGANLQSAIAKAAAGDLTAAKAILEDVMADPGARALVEKLRENTNG